MARSLVYSGPIYEKLTVSGNKVILNFKHVGGGLVAKDGELTGFTIAGEDKKFYQRHRQDRRRDGRRLERQGPQSQGRALRLGQISDGQLVEHRRLAGQSPFRTDDFPAITRDVK